ncbi:MAG: hypothetical protein ABGZ53_24080, partial [Fuerstiella sp.]
QIVDEDDPEQNVALTGISAGPANKLADVRIIPQLHDTTVVAIAIGANVIGQTLTVDGTIFTYVDAAVMGSLAANPIAVDLTHATQVVAVATAAAINAHSQFALGTAVAFENTINISNTADAATALVVTGSSTESFAIAGSANIISAPVVDYVSRAATGGLRYTPIGDAFGVVTVTVTTEDAGLDGIFDNNPLTVVNESLDNNSISDTFTISVKPINDDPTMDQIDAQTTSEGDLEQNVLLTGITAGPINELEDIRISAQLLDTISVAVAIGDNVIGIVGETLTLTTAATVGDTIFTFVDADSVASPTSQEIAVKRTDSTLDVASTAAAVINNELGAGTVVASTNTINTIDPQTTIVGSSTEAFAVMPASTIITAPVVDYNSRDATATLRYTPIGDQFGVVTVTVTTEDAGVDGLFGATPSSAEALDNLSITRTFTITVNPVNDDPTMNPISDEVVNEDSGEQSVSLTGISAGLPINELEDVRLSWALTDATIVAIASGENVIGEMLSINGQVFTFVNTALVATPTAIEIPVSATGTTFDAAAATATVVNAFFGSMLAQATQNHITLATNSTNVSAPAPGYVPNGNVNRFAISNQNDLITNPAIDYVSRDATGTFRYTPGDHEFGGPITVTITTEDAGIDGIFGALLSPEAADNLFITQSFTIMVNPINDDPTMDAIADQVVDEDAGEQTVVLTGISAGPVFNQTTQAAEPGNELEDLRITHTLSDATIVAIAIGPNVVGETLTVNGTGFDFVDTNLFPFPTQTEIAVDTADSTFDVAAAAAAKINALLGGGTAQATQNYITLNYNSTLVTGSSTEAFAISNQNDLITNSMIDGYTSRDRTANFKYTPGTNRFGGPITVTITTEDAGLDGIFDDDTTTGGVDESADNNSIDRSFTIMVNPINDDPTMNAIGNQVVNEDDPEQSVPLTGITVGPDAPGPLNELEDYRITAERTDTTIVAIAIGEHVVGETLVVDGVTFTYVDAMTFPLTPEQIAVNATDSTFDVAANSAT